EEHQAACTCEPGDYGDGALEATDQELLRAAVGGDDGAFHTLVDRHASHLFRIAMSLSQNRADAEDLLQETFIGAYRGMKKFAGRASVKTRSEEHTSELQSPYD